MSLLLTPDELEGWAGVLERRFVAASQSEDTYAEGARAAHRGAVAWIKDDSMVKGSFRWVCDALDLEPDAVRRAMFAKVEDKAALLRGLM